MNPVLYGPTQDGGVYEKYEDGSSSVTAPSSSDGVSNALDNFDYSSSSSVSDFLNKIKSAFGDENFANQLTDSVWLDELLNEYWFNKNNAFNQGSADKANEFTKQMAEMYRKWDLEDRENYYSDLVKGMKKAGINPIYAFQNGGVNYSAPSYSSSSGQSASVSSHKSSYKSDEAFAGEKMAKFLVSIAKLLAGMV